MENKFYDDYAINPKVFETMAKEFKNQENNILGLKLDKNGTINSNKSQQNFFDKVERENSDTQNKIDIVALSKLFVEIENLQKKLVDLLVLTSNKDVVFVLKEVMSETEIEKQNLINTFEDVARENALSKTQDVEEDVKHKMFCNGLKSSINIVECIIKLLIHIKDGDVLFEYSTMLTHSTNLFLDINSKLVSFFGDCKFRTFGLFNKK